MRDRALLTIDESNLVTAANEWAKRIDTFLIKRERSLLSKLVAIGGVTQEESFEVQIKAKIEDAQKVLDGLKSDEITILRHAHYHEYDSYFLFDGVRDQIRYREDEFINDKGDVEKARYRLTLLGESQEREFTNSVLLFRSRYLAPATQSLRFYREYFQPIEERDVEKDRRRWLVVYRGVEFFVNLDQLTKPEAPGYFVEIKSRTWSKRDAEYKAKLMVDLLAVFGAKPDQSVTERYIEITPESTSSSA